MTTLRDVLDAVADHGAAVLLGVTIVLGAGVLAMLLHHAPAQRRRLGITTAVGVLLYLAVAVAPLPRIVSLRWPANGAIAGAAERPRDAAPAGDASERAQALQSALRGLHTPFAAGDGIAGVAAPAGSRAAWSAWSRDGRAPSGAAELPGADESAPASAPDALADGERSAAALTYSLAGGDGGERTAPSTVASPGDERLAPGGAFVTVADPYLDSDRQRAAAAGDAPAAGAFARVLAWPWPTLGGAAWLLGAAWMLVRTLAGHARLRAVLRRCTPVATVHLRGVELPRGARVLASDAPLRPFCAGWWRPVIVVPRALLAPDRADEAHAVLHHEAAHLRAGDPRALTLLAWLAVPLFVHPLFWWLRREVRFCSELLADDAAAGAADRQRYARALIDLAERTEQPLVAAGTVAVFHRPSEFYRRIQMLLQRQAPLSTSTSRLRRAVHAAATCGLVATSASLFGVNAPAQDPARAPLQRENAELRETIGTLRTELADLRSQIRSLREGGEIAPLGAVSSDPEVSRRLAAMLDDLRRTTNDAPRVPGARADDLADRRLLELLREHGVGTAGVPADGPAAPAQDPSPVAPGAPGLPLLAEIPLLDRLFTPGSAAAAPNAMPLQDPSPTRVYTVRKGDNVQRIAQRELGATSRAAEIKALNPGVEPDRLRLGQQLVLPAAPAPGPAPGPLPDAIDAPAVPAYPSAVRPPRAEADDESVPGSASAMQHAAPNTPSPAEMLGATSREPERSFLAEMFSPRTAPPAESHALPAAPGSAAPVPGAPSGAAPSLPGGGMPGAVPPDVPAASADAPTSTSPGHPAPALAPASARADDSSAAAALADLTSRFVDLQAELELQRLVAAEAEELARAGHGTKRDALQATLTVRALERKLAIATRLIDGEIRATEAELVWLDRRRAECTPVEAMQLDVQLHRARTRLESLRSVK